MESLKPEGDPCRPTEDVRRLCFHAFYQRTQQLATVYTHLATGVTAQRELPHLFCPPPPDG